MKKSTHMSAFLSSKFYKQVIILFCRFSSTRDSSTLRASKTSSFAASQTIVSFFVAAEAAGFTPFSTFCANHSVKVRSVLLLVSCSSFFAAIWCSSHYYDLSILPTALQNARCVIREPNYINIHPAHIFRLLHNLITDCLKSKILVGYTLRGTKKSSRMVLREPSNFTSEIKLMLSQISAYVNTISLRHSYLVCMR